MTDISPSDLRRLQAGDATALAAVYSSHGDRVYRLCRNMLGQDADAEDATQEVFLRVLDKAGQFHGRSAFATWLYRLTVNHCLTRRQGDRRRRRLLSALDDREHPPARQPGPVEVTARNEARAEVDRLLSELPPPLRAVIVLHEIEDLRYREMAEVLGVPVGTVMSRLSRARDRLAAATGGDAFGKRPMAKAAR